MLCCRCTAGTSIALPTTSTAPSPPSKRSPAEPWPCSTQRFITHTHTHTRQAARCTLGAPVHTEPACCTQRPQAPCKQHRTHAALAQPACTHAPRHTRTCNACITHARAPLAHTRATHHARTPCTHAARAARAQRMHRSAHTAAPCKKKNNGARPDAPCPRTHGPACTRTYPPASAAPHAAHRGPSEEPSVRCLGAGPSRAEPNPSNPSRAAPSPAAPAGSVLPASSRPPARTLALPPVPPPPTTL